MSKMLALKNEEWEMVDVQDLMPGDQVWDGDTVMRVDRVENKPGKGLEIHVSPLPGESDKGASEFPAQEYPSIADAMEFTNSDLATYTDGTAQLCNFDDVPLFNSPRLPILDLDMFCKKYAGRYKTFCLERVAAKKVGKVATMNKWWMN